MGGSGSVATQATYDPEQPMSSTENQLLLKEEPKQTCSKNCFLSCCLKWLLRCCPMWFQGSLSSGPNWLLSCLSHCPQRFLVFLSCLVCCPNCFLSLQRCRLSFLRCCPCCPSSPRSDPPYERVRTYEKGFPVQIRTSGKTGGCERQFVQEVSNLLSDQTVSLRVEESTETPKDLLLVFCPIASRMGTDIKNALEGLSGDQKAILVVMHLISPDNTETFLDTRRQATHPAVVLTVHTRYTLQGGFYPCEMNMRAMADVAAEIKDLTEDNLWGDLAAPSVHFV